MSLLGWAWVCLAAAAVAAVFATGRVVRPAAGIARILFYIFLALFAVLLALRLLA